MGFKRDGKARRLTINAKEEQGGKTSSSSQPPSQGPDFRGKIDGGGDDPGRPGDDPAPLSDDYSPPGDDGVDDPCFDGNSEKKKRYGVGDDGDDVLQPYLLLLSLYQTLRYRNLSFWRFLLSGETDIVAFSGRSR
jgi:hypothetical protein